jgi:hypothetical protein
VNEKSIEKIKKFRLDKEDFINNIEIVQTELKKKVSRKIIEKFK